MNNIKNKGLKVPLKQAEKIRKELSERKLLLKNVKMKKDQSFIYFPLKNTPNDKIFSKYTIQTIEFEKNEIKYNSYQDRIEIPNSLKRELPTSYDIIGKILLIKLTNNLLQYKREIGNALLKSNKNIKTVCLVESVSGEFRTRHNEVISGENQTRTIHKEYGLEFEIDISKTYFTPRLANERMRISKLVEPNEVIIDMFAGIAPISITIARYAKPKIIYAVDKNKDAIEYAKINIKKNRVLDKIELLYSDAKNLPNILDKKGVKADRIIMNLPFSAYTFFKYTLEIISNVCIIHYYDIIKEADIPQRLNLLTRIAQKNNIILTSLVVNKIKSYSPREFYICVDITAKKD